MTTIGSSASSTTSQRTGSLSGGDSYTDLSSRGYPYPPSANMGGAAKDGQTPVQDSPTVPMFETVRTRKIVTDEDLHIMDTKHAEGLDEEDETITGTVDKDALYGDTASIRAAADVGMRRLGGLTQKPSESRILRPSSSEDGEDLRSISSMDSPGETVSKTSMERPRFGKTASSRSVSIVRENIRSTAQPISAQTYDSSDDESTASSVQSSWTKTSESPLRGQSSAFATTRARPSAASPSSGRIAEFRPQSSGLPQRPMTASPLGTSLTGPSLSKARSVGGLEVPRGAPTNSDGTSRLSNYPVGKAASIHVSPTHTSGAVSKSGGVTSNMTSVTRSDSTSSATSSSTAPHATQHARPSTASSSAASVAIHTRPRSTTQVQRDRKTSMRVPLAISEASSNRMKPPPILEPPLPVPEDAPKVSQAPASGMYWYKAPTHGQDHRPLRAHTSTLVGSNIYVFGGCDSRTCFNELHVFDADSMSWSKPDVYGDIPPPLRAMTATAVRNKIVIFGGGEGPTYYNDIYVYDTQTSRYSQPQLAGSQQPCRRRAHTACLYKNGIYVFGGGDGVRALNDVWRLDVTDLTRPSWKLICPPTSGASTRAGTSTVNGSKTQLRPTARGYHTANMVGSKLIIYGGSDGDDCFKDVWVFDVDTNVWRCVEIKKSFSRLSHTATIIGSYLFVVGGHDGIEYSSEVLLLNLVTMQWDRRKVYGMPPSGRGYHGAVLYDSRLFIVGGFDGKEVFNDTYILELAVSSYYSQISHFSIVVTSGSG